jgi:pimeloyl-ACP methyl ester carboxylesterase
MQLNFKSLGQGPPLVLLHGLFGSLDNWLGVTPKLAQHFQLFLLDLRNHGASPHSPEMNYPALAADLAEFFDAQKLDAANLLGHSLGGKVAMQFAFNFPARLEKLIVVDIDPRAYPHEHDVIFAALLALDLKNFHSRKEVEDALAPAIPDLALRRFLLKNLKLISSSSSSSSSFEWRIPLHAIFENYPKLCRALPAKEPFPKPTLFIRGGQSPYINDADFPLIHQLFSHATIETIPSARHWVHADAPDEFVRLILEFLNSP